MRAIKSPIQRFEMQGPTEFFQSIDDWRASQRPIMPRAKAIRVLISRALETEALKSASSQFKGKKPRAEGF